jgi:hypothetical protein
MPNTAARQRIYTHAQLYSPPCRMPISAAHLVLLQALGPLLLKLAAQHGLALRLLLGAAGVQALAADLLAWQHMNNAAAAEAPMETRCVSGACAIYINAGRSQRPGSCH